MKVTLGKPYQLPSGRWYVYLDCPDGKMRRFSCKAASPVFEVYQNQNTRRVPRRQVKTRFDILARDNYTCQYCGRKAPDVALHVDHKVPVAKGGTDDLENLLTACADCNLGKWTRHSEPPKTMAEQMRDAANAMDRLLAPRADG